MNSSTNPKLAWSLIGTLAVFSICTLVLGGITLHNMQMNEAWEESYTMLVQQRDELAEKHTEARQQLYAIENTLDRSEDDVVALEQRVAELANEKAQVEDEREFNILLLEYTEEMNAAYDSLAEIFTMCIDEYHEFALLALESEFFTQEMADQADYVDHICGEAYRYLNDLRGFAPDGR